MGKEIVRDAVKGYVQGFYVENDIWKPATSQRRNLIMYDWATVVSKLLQGAPDGKTYKIGGMYLEFANNGGLDEDVPDYDREDGISYYDGLGLSATRDYLRVPVTAMTGSSSDNDLYPGGNTTSIYVQTSSGTGVHGKTFSDAQNSRVFGCALVSYPVFADATQDLVIARFYFPVDEQIDKLANQEIGVAWQLVLE